jgi:uncharacterized protein with HEPN domain
VAASERDDLLLNYIRESIDLIEEYTSAGRDAFLARPMIQDAVLRRLETLTDAASHLSRSLKARHPQIAWRDIRGFRNVAAHAYLSLNMERVWRTVTLHLPALKRAVDEELARLGPSESQTEPDRGRT